MEQPIPKVTKENKPVSNLGTDEKVWRTCRHCSHKWMGKPTSTICPKKGCKKYVGPVKGVKESDEIKSTIKIEPVDGTLPPLPPLLEAIDGTPKVEATDAPTVADIPADTYINLAGFPFDIVAEHSKKPYWKLTEKEKATLAPLLKKVGDKWIGKWFEKYPEEGALALAFGMIIMGKFALEMSYRKDMKKQSPVVRSFKPKQNKGFREEQPEGGVQNE